MVIKYKMKLLAITLPHFVSFVLTRQRTSDLLISSKIGDIHSRIRERWRVVRLDHDTNQVSTATSYPVKTRGSYRLTY